MVYYSEVTKLWKTSCAEKVRKGGYTPLAPSPGSPRTIFSQSHRKFLYGKGRYHIFQMSSKGSGWWELYKISIRLKGCLRFSDLKSRDLRSQDLKSKANLDFGLKQSNCIGFKILGPQRPMALGSLFVQSLWMTNGLNVINRCYEPKTNELLLHCVFHPKV